MADDELEAIRQRRMQQLMQQYGGPNAQGGAPTQEQAKEQEEQQQAAEERRQAMLASVLQPEARERLSRIALVKPDKARGVENMVLAAAQRGQLRDKLSEEQLIGMLETISEQAASRTKVTITRRRNVWDDDD